VHSIAHNAGALECRLNRCPEGLPHNWRLAGRREQGDANMQRNSRLQELVPKLVLGPSFLIVLVFVYGFIIYTGVLSLTNSRMLPSYGFVGLANYSKLWALPHWWRAITNLAIFASLYINHLFGDRTVFSDPS
jgi:glucose/mannose transport system permease protein